MYTRTQQRNHATTNNRTPLIQSVIYFLLFAVVTRLFYWQIIKGSELQAQAESQYKRVTEISGERGKIYTADGHILVTNKKVYTVFAQPPQLTKSPTEIALQLADILSESLPPEQATSTASLKEFRQDIELKLTNKDKQWIAIQHRVSEHQKERIQALSLHGVGFDTELVRAYPEASMAAQLSGFVGKNDVGEDTGYFGIEGKFDRELRGQSGRVEQEKDAVGIPIFFAPETRIPAQPGRDITLTIHRDLQLMLEDHIQRGIQKYGAVSGEAVIMDPKTGNILGLASFPKYNQEDFYKFDPVLYRNPLASESYEPGSTFKVLTVSAGIDAGVITPETECTSCATARRIAGFTIKNWNDTYNPNITIKDGLAKSDNTSMIFVAEQLGIDKFVEYMHRFQIGKPSGVELQEDAGSIFRDKWRPIDLATSSFGQGISLTGLQMVKAVGAIANQGTMMKPKIIQSVKVSGTQNQVEPEVAGQPISAQTAKIVTEMMIHAAHSGEAQWAVLKNYTIAGKTGTAQIPVAGHYDKEKTIASFIGFAPAHDPQFVMLVKLREPQTSQWASETAAPLWYDLAQELFNRMNILPDK